MKFHFPYSKFKALKIKMNTVSDAEAYIINHLIDNLMMPFKWNALDIGM